MNNSIAVFDVTAARASYTASKDQVEDLGSVYARILDACYLASTFMFYSVDKNKVTGMINVLQVLGYTTVEITEKDPEYCHMDNNRVTLKISGWAPQEKATPGQAKPKLPPAPGPNFMKEGSSQVDSADTLTRLEKKTVLYQSGVSAYSNSELICLVWLKTLYLTTIGRLIGLISYVKSEIP